MRNAQSKKSVQSVITDYSTDFTSRIISKQTIRKGVYKVTERNAKNVSSFKQLLSKTYPIIRSARSISYDSVNGSFNTDNGGSFTGDEFISMLARSSKELSGFAIEPKSGKVYFNRTSVLDYNVLAPFFSV